MAPPLLPHLSTPTSTPGLGLEGLAFQDSSASPTIVVMHGDQTGEELLTQALRLLDPAVIGFPVALEHYDLSLEQRRHTQNQVVWEAAKATKRTGLALKAATITPERSGDVGSPNAILREALGAQVILRTGRRIPGIRPIAGIYAPISVVRMAVDDAYGAKEWREPLETGDELSWRTTRLSRAICRAVAEFTFQQAQHQGAKVFGGPKFTVSATYEGLFKEELDAAAQRYPQVPYQPLLIDATFALLLQTSGEALVIPALNRDGDLLSDLVLQLYGSIAGAESLVLSLDTQTLGVTCVMAEAPHGTAPALVGKNIANPMAMILAVAALLGYGATPQATQASKGIYQALFQTLEAGHRTPDLGGSLSTSGFTDRIIEALLSLIKTP